MSKDPIRDNKLSPHIALLGVQVFFGTLPVIGKVVLKTIPAVSLVGFRVGIAAIALVFVQRFRGNMRLNDPRDYLRLFVLSILGVTLNQMLFIGGLSLTKASNTSLLAVTIPIFALTIGSLFGLEKLTGIKIAGIALAGIGVILLIDPRNASFSSATTIGDLMIIVNSLSYGIYVAISKETITRNGALKSIAWIFVFASIICVPWGTYSMYNSGIESVAPVTWFLILYIGLFATAAPYLLNAWALARVNPSVVAVFVYLQPLIGFGMAIIFLGEKLDLKLALAAILVFAGLFLVTKKFKPQAIVS